MAAMENYCHRAVTILKDVEERKKEIQVVNLIARANGYQPDEVDSVIGKISARAEYDSVEIFKSRTICRKAH